MYNRLTLVEKLPHKDAIAKIYNDHKHLPGFSQRNIRRNLPSDNPYVPRRVRTAWPKNSSTTSNVYSRLNNTIQEQDKELDTAIIPASKLGESKDGLVQGLKECPNCKALSLENYELKEALSRNTTLVPANQIHTHETKLAIPKGKYSSLQDAMQRSRDSISVVFDNSGILERAIPDIFTEGN